MLSFTNVKSSLKIDYNTQYKMSLEDSKGTKSSIKYLPPDKPNEGLRLRPALDGNQTHELGNRVTKITNICIAAVSINLSQREAATMLNRRLMPQTTCVMHLSQFSKDQCQQPEKLILRTFLPLLIINRSTPVCWSMDRSNLEA